ncbi:Spy0128 family protein [Collinsella sp. AM18-10]|uniref:Spy0128 family protein n=1 Tax=Collinsella sp. AM18-10 TaxID=2292028 RepID=UPI000E54BA72|nr:FctA domain-containing protein [Collinsella sp. AM18-10]RHH37140.1 hypothetical protein DW211_00020 [Collinsella sp. AM18-10]
MKANSNKSKQSNKATRRVLAGVLCGASVLSLVLSLVMPPISQAIANDAQTVSTEKTVTGGGSSSESTDVDSTNNGDTENQNSDDAGNGASEDNVAADSTADGAEVKGAERPADDGANGDGAISLAAENEPTHEISSGTDLNLKLLNKDLRDGNGAATFKLTADIEYDDEIRLEGANTKITLDLNGFKIKHGSGASPLFDVADYATLTVMDSGKVPENVADGQQLQDKDEHLTPDNYGKTAIMSYDVNDVPKDLTYYVTESTASGVDTTEKIKEYKATIKGAIVGVTKNSTMRLINVYQHGTFNLVSGAITQKKDCNVGNLIYAENGSTVNMSGGYVCGATSNSRGAGIELGVKEGNGATLNLTNGVIAGNCAGAGGGVYASGVGVPANDPNKTTTKINMTGGIISGNSTLNVGLGGGIMAEGGIVTVSGGYITNNRMAKFCGHDGNGDHGGAGLAANNGAHVTISDGQITGNYSEEAGGGVYVTDAGRQNCSRKDTAWLNITGGTIASNVSFRSEGAGIRVGQMVDAMINGTPDSNGTLGRKVYITNNYCMSRFDWGGGGIFVQGNSNEGMEKTAGRLFVYNSYISSNTAGGYGGGVAVCPTGKTLVTNTKGTAIFGNKSAGAEYDNDDHNSKPYDKDNNFGNDVTPHLSGGGSGKNQDKDAYRSKVFRDRGHADFFLAAAAGHQEPLAAVIGKMLGDGDAKYSGSKERSDTKELSEPIDIPANGGVKIYRSIGLSSGVIAGSDEANKAQEAAGTFITGNYSWDHGGGIMSNGDLYLGVPADTYVYPSLKLKASKALKNKQTEESMALAEDQFSFSVYRKDSGHATRPYWNDKTFSDGGCTLVGTAKNDASGNITFDLGEQFIDKTVEANKITYYLVEQAGGDSGIEYDRTVYEVEVRLTDNKTLLMKVPKKDDPNESVELYVHNCTIASVSVTRHSENSSSLLGEVQPGGDGYYSIGCSDGSKTFTNKYTPPYTSSGSWTPMATKVVEGGEMKEFTLEFADNENFDGAKTVMTDPDGVITTTADGKKSQIRSFDEIEYKLDQLDKLKNDSTGRGASKTFTYFVREQQPTTPFTNYKYDQSIYQITVNAVDDTEGKINISATYKQIQDRDGKPVTNDTGRELTESSIPTFTNTYSTTLPLSGMSGVTLTYLAGAAVLCAAAAWMHIRRKANAKGGERRE